MGKLVFHLLNIKIKTYSHLGISLIFGYDVIHGYITMFPIPLDETASWEPELARRSSAIAAREAAAAGINWMFAPRLMFPAIHAG